MGEMCAPDVADTLRTMKCRNTQDFAWSGSCLLPAHALAEASHRIGACFEVPSTVLSLVRLHRPSRTVARIPEVGLLQEAQGSGANPTVPLQGLSADLLPADVFDDLLPEAPRTSRQSRRGTSRLLGASTDRPVGSMLQDLSHPNGRASRPARDPLSRSVSGGHPRADGVHSPRPLRDVHRPTGSGARDRDGRRSRFVARLRHRPGPSQRKWTASRSASASDRSPQSSLCCEHPQNDSGSIA